MIIEFNDHMFIWIPSIIVIKGVVKIKWSHDCKLPEKDLSRNVLFFTLRVRTVWTLWGSTRWTPKMHHFGNYLIWGSLWGRHQNLILTKIENEQIHKRIKFKKYVFLGSTMYFIIMSLQFNSQGYARIYLRKVHCVTRLFHSCYFI